MNNKKKQFWPISKLKNWKDNPRDITKKDFERLRKQIRDLGEYKPLIVCKGSKVLPDGTVLGGNMRLRAYRELGFKRVWVSFVSPKTKADALKYALSDNDRAGYYEDDILVELISPLKNEINLEDFSIDIKEPLKLSKLISEYELEEQSMSGFWSVDDYREAILKKTENMKFPFRTKNDIELINDFYDLCQSQEKMSIAGYIIGMELHHTIWTVKILNKKTPYDNWMPKSRERALKHIFLPPNEKVTLYVLRSIMGMVLAGQKCYQFRPALARWYYAKYAKDGDLIVDPSAGWGGRMLGWLSLGWKGNFIGTDPSPDSNEGNMKILEFLGVNTKRIELIKTPFEDWNCKQYFNKVGMIITSPPYFNTEQYVGEDQSFRRYPKLNLWVNEFLRNYIKKCGMLLKKGRYFILNIGPVGKEKVNLEKDIKRFIKEGKLKLEEIITEQVATGFGDRRNVGEPFYICKKI